MISTIVISPDLNRNIRPISLTLELSHMVSVGQKMWVDMILSWSHPSKFEMSLWNMAWGPAFLPSAMTTPREWSKRLQSSSAQTQLMFAFHVMETRNVSFHNSMWKWGSLGDAGTKSNKQTCLVQFNMCQVWVIYWEIQRKYLIGSHLGTESTEIPRGKGWKLKKNIPLKLFCQQQSENERC